MLLFDLDNIVGMLLRYHFAISEFAILDIDFYFVLDCSTKLHFFLKKVCFLFGGMENISYLCIVFKRQAIFDRLIQIGNIATKHFNTFHYE